MTPEELYRTLAKTVWLVAGICFMFWFFDAAITGLLFALLVFVLSTALSAPITWLEHKGMRRWLATVLTSLVCLGVTVFLGWLVVPQVIAESSAVAEKMPEYSAALDKRISSLHPALKELVPQFSEDGAEKWAPAISSFLGQIGRYSMNVLGFILAFFLVVTTVIYAAAAPRAVVRGLIQVFPTGKQERAAKALAQGSQAVVGWVWSTVIIGGIQAIAAGIFLTWIGIPGAMVWAVFTFVAELVPRFGAYLMAIPPILVALATNPMDAVWVAVFYIAIQFVAGDVIGPLVRAQRMKLHAVSIILASVLLGAAFGMLGLILAIPLVGYVKAFYDQFYANREPQSENIDELVEAVLDRRDPGEVAPLRSGLRDSPKHFRSL